MEIVKELKTVKEEEISEKKVIIVYKVTVAMFIVNMHLHVYHVRDRLGRRC